eukprot:1207664-Pyramimonas_sp.AAC.1
MTWSAGATSAKERRGRRGSGGGERRNGRSVRGVVRRNRATCIRAQCGKRGPGRENARSASSGLPPKGTRN